MISIRKYSYKAFCGIVAALLLAAVPTACNDDDDSGKGRVRWDETRTIHPDREGSTALIVSGRAGLPWTAEIVSGDWMSFDAVAPGNQTVKTGAVGKELADKYQFIYYWPNTVGEERHAVIRFTFEGQPSVEIELTQYSPAGEKDVYETGRSAVWPEIPAKLDANPPGGKININNLTYVTHTAMMNERNARNYTMCYDRTKLAAWWVAYPLHASYTGSGRSDAWAYDPKIDMQYQANLERSYQHANYDRGHQVPNADRNGVAAMAAQTFYYSNMTPQNSQLNQQPWGALESKARDSWICSDTLYVVTGAYWQTNNVTVPDIDGKECPVPDYYFKVFVRTVAGNVRTPGDCLADHSCKSIGFWVANNSNQGTARNWVKSVAEIEALTGFEFFPTVSADVKDQKDASSWGL